MFGHKIIPYMEVESKTKLQSELNIYYLETSRFLEECIACRAQRYTKHAFM